MQQVPQPHQGTNRTVWIVVGIVLVSVVVLVAVIGAGIFVAQGLNPVGPPRFTLQSTQGIDPCDFPSRFWNGGSGTDIEWQLPANRVPASSCSFSATFRNTGGAGGGHVTFAARYGPEYEDPQSYWHVRFIKDSVISCRADIPTTQSGSESSVRCGLSAPDPGEYLGHYTYSLS